MNLRPPQPLSLRRWKKQRRDAHARGIDYELSYQEYLDWWISNGVDKNIKMPLTRDTLCMCRFNDTGPYKLDNIYCATLSQNQRDARRFNPNYGNTRSLRIHTPAGEFPSKKSAAQHYKIIPIKLEQLMSTDPDNYYYL